ncbi:MAG: hypothetical protein AB1567_09020 [bacterium]
MRGYEDEKMRRWRRTQFLIFLSSHLLIFSSSYLLIFLSSHLLIFSLPYHLLNFFHTQKPFKKNG